MTPITRIEAITAWQEARELVNQVYTLTSREPLSKDYGLRDQLQRAAISIMANIAEGFDCDSNIEFARFLGIARRSAAEVQSLLYASHDIGYITEEEFKTCYDQAAKTKGLIGGFKRAVEKKTNI
jgi:four helix bundle protein